MFHLTPAAKNILIEDCKRMEISTSSVTTGAIIGKVNLVDVKKYDSDKELYTDKKKHHSISSKTNNKYGFILENPKKLRIKHPAWKSPRKSAEFFIPA